ncbi:hypothetical protein AMECASPLE_026498 [Ameca splendens]|uniref:Uncharacterized protein n=1 Tax=Ameca splendens TaxID=208324 RepID=A0ABV0YG87_9TELE
MQLAGSDKTGETKWLYLPVSRRYDQHNCSSVQVVQMLSEGHDINAITIWLTEWIHADEAMSHVYLAIHVALAKSFTPHPDLKIYIKECFHVSLGNQSAKLTPCFIRVVAAYCIQMICQ